jgi:hypothetical protein
MYIMNKWFFGLVGVFLSLSVFAHEMTPTYPSWKQSAFSGVVQTTMEMFNKRQDVDYYEVGIFDKDWKPVPFVSSYKIFKLHYLGHVKFDIFIRKEDKERAVYVCSKSKLRKSDEVRTAISSKICSKFR